MREPRTLIELRQQWLQRIVKGGDRLLAQRAVQAEALRPAFCASMERLQQLLQDPDRDREDVVTALRLFGVGEALVQHQDIPALIELARTAREVRGPGSQYVEKDVLRALVQVADEETLPFLVECFRYSRPRDGSAGYRRAIVLKGITAIALLSGNEEALDILDEALTHKLWRVRLAACRAIREVGGLSPRGLPPRLEQRLRHIVQHEQARGIRLCAELALEEAGPGGT
ncbi:MAG: HEAT repeat domain-containing protein [Anaerolineales bacterium]|nr:HEAT repeat domain-containing protein [Anaerolineales bacterium]